MDATGVLGSVVLLDWATVLTYASFLGIALGGAVMRSILGLYRGYTTYQDFQPSKVRMGIEIVASAGFGLVAVSILGEMGIFKFGLNLTAFFAGLMGADLIGLITKKLGITKGMNVVLDERQLKDLDLTENQIRAMHYARTKGEITNRAYQKINSSSHDVAKRDLGSLVKKGRLWRRGGNKRTRYLVRGQGENRAFSGTPKSASLKSPGKCPVGCRPE
jgi:hypothetical protein